MATMPRRPEAFRRLRLALPGLLLAAGPLHAQPGPLAFRALAAGDLFTCGLAEDGRAWCWGTNYLGQLGARTAETCPDGTVTDAACSTRPVAVAGGHRFAGLAAGADHACAVTQDGSAFCWGNAADGVLGAERVPEACPAAYYGPPPPGRADPPAACSREPLRLPSPVRLHALAAGIRFTCGLDPAGAAWCWGKGYGAAPRRVPGAYRFVQLSAGPGEACGVTRAGAVLCWSAARRAVPRREAPGLRFSLVSRGWDHTCALTAAGTAWCWGDNGMGELGNGATDPSVLSEDEHEDTMRERRPVRVVGGLRLRSIQAGLSETCGISVDGGLYCWGSSLLAASRDRCWAVDEYSPCETRPRRMADVKFRSVAIGVPHACAVTESGEVFCMGGQASGAFGNGTAARESPPAPVRGALPPPSP
jgi:alpha-tubulin suppressor-like RCC1 family protein